MNSRESHRAHTYTHHGRLARDHTGNLLLVMRLSVIRRTGGSESTVPMMGMLRKNPLRDGVRRARARRQRRRL